MNNIERVYIIAPLTTEWKEVLALKAKILIRPITEVSFYNRGTRYTEESLRNADKVIIMLPNNKFSYRIDSLPMSSKAELESARNLGKKIYLGYRSSEGMNIYSIDFREDISKFQTIFGIGGTSFNFFREEREVTTNPCSEILLPTIESERPSVLFKESTLNRRLLLLS